MRALIIADQPGGVCALTGYQFRESIVGGYVRLRAEEKGLELALDYAAGTATSTTKWRPGGARRSRRGMTAKDLERLRNPQQ